MKNALFILDQSSYEEIYGFYELKRIKKHTNIIGPVLSAEEAYNSPKLLGECNYILSGWGGPCIDKRFLDMASKLEAVFYGAGSIRGIVTPEFWKKGITITSSWAANAIPVAEYTFAQVILCLKRAYTLNYLYTNDYPVIAKNNKGNGAIYPHTKERKKVLGTYKTTVGVVSLGMIGRKVCELLKSIDVKVIAYDPFITIEDAADLGVELVSLEELFSKSDVVSLHTPLLPSTENMIKGSYFKLMKYGASFINTARGAIVNEEQMIEVLRERKDITAVLDVTFPEPPDTDSSLFKMKNVFLTPHIAGSVNNECKRMGEYAVDELIRFIEGNQLKYQIREENYKNLA